MICRSGAVIAPIMPFKEHSPIFSTFFPTFEDFDITRKFMFFSQSILQLKSVAFGRINEKVAGYGIIMKLT